MFRLRHLAYATAFLLLFESSGLAKPDFDVAEVDVEQQLALLPLPPDVAPITTSDILDVVSPSHALRGRSAYLSAIAQEAAANGMPPAVVDAVVRIESRYDPTAVGSVGEVGLMQVRPKTAELLGFEGAPADLAEPRTNLRYGVSYLAKAWRLAGGDLCRALMKYRAGHGSEKMSALSVEYCRRARLHLAAVGIARAAAVEALARPTMRPRKHEVQIKRVTKRNATAALQRRHLPATRLSLRASNRGVGTGGKNRIARVRARLAVHYNHRKLWLVHQGPQTPRAPKNRLAFR